MQVIYIDDYLLIVVDALSRGKHDGHLDDVGLFLLLFVVLYRQEHLTGG